MSKKLIYVIGGIVAILALYYFFSLKTNQGPQPLSGDYKTATYQLAGNPIKIGKGGIEYFGNEVSADFNQDKRDDVAFLISQKGTEGTAYYVVAGINTPDGYFGSQAVFIGKDIQPQTTELRTSKKDKPLVVVNYAEGSAPSVGKSIVLIFNTNDFSFGEVVQNFEGEASPSEMSLSMKTWEWQTTADKQGKFTITFAADGTFSAKTDCNNVGGTYTVKKGALSFGKNMFSTKMFCEGSKEQEYTKLLSDAVGYAFSGQGELIVALTEKRTMSFK